MAIVFYKRICIVLYKLVYFKNNIILGIFLNDVKGCGGGHYREKETLHTLKYSTLLAFSTYKVH